MALQIPLTQDLINDNIARIEGQLNQNTPDNDKAFNKVLATMEGMNDAQIWRYARERAAQANILTANLDTLKNIYGPQFDVDYSPAEQAQLTVQATGTNGTIIPAGTDFIGDANGALYYSDGSATISGGTATFNVTCDAFGVIGNLAISDTLTVGTQIAGLNAQITITVILNLGVEDENIEVYRQKILDKERNPGGGGNTADYRNWSQEVAGVARAYPYSGLPYGSTSTATAVDRTVYVEADTSIDPDGIAPSSLLDSVRDSINTDPDTGIARPPLGLTDATLYVESITRLSIYSEIRNLDVDSSILSQVQSDINDAIELYLRRISPFIPGLDAESEREDTITAGSLADVIQDVVKSVGGNFESVSFGLSPVSSISAYTLNPGEKTKTGAVSYVTT